MPRRARITIHPDFPIGEISPRLFSAFLEPIGTMVNGTMYNPKHKTADEQGFRTDFIEALKKTGLPAVRLPGGNFVSAWQWKDSIGPKDQRKVHLDPAWYQYITNEVGHDEYLQWAEKTGVAPLYTVNLGTGTMQDAMDIVEYTNHEGGTYWSDLRRKYGHEKPYGVDTWYLGNEMDGHWQLGSWEKDPRGYGILCQETSKAMKWIDPTIKTAVCGSSAPFMEHFPEWDEKVLDQCYDVVDYLSIHHYHAAAPGDLLSLLGGAEYYEDFINTEIAMCDFVASKHRSPKKMMISFDEYGGMSGIITITDLVEELVGDFADDPEDEPAARLEQTGENTWTVPGISSLSDVCEELEVTLPADKYETFGGYVIAELGEIPKDGSQLTLEAGGLKIAVLEVKHHRIEVCRVNKLKTEKKDGEDAE